MLEPQAQDYLGDPDSLISTETVSAVTMNHNTDM